ncbi:MAG: DUF58 domain-containing protein [Alphaproteobacteria bacterium]|nr:DUF58 domain-containing protein [Alphaproteobacteria bacterium]
MAPSENSGAGPSGTMHWDPDVLTRVAWLQLRARQAVAGLVHGAHRSMAVTSNIEFADYKEYSPGDPLRDLDWKVAGRTDRLVVRRHNAESHLPATLVFDASGDLGTGQDGRYKRPPLDGSKFGYAVTLAGTLAWFLSHGGDPVGLSVIAGEEPGRDGVRWPFVPPRGGRGHLAQVLAQLAALRPAGSAGLGPAFEAVGGRLQRRSLVIVISDLMEEPASWGPALTALARRNVDLRVVHLYDPREWSLDYGDMVRFLSPEGGAPVPLDPAAVRGEMATVVDEYLAEVRGWLARHRGVHVLVPTDAPLELALGRVLGAVAGHVGDRAVERRA